MMTFIRRALPVLVIWALTACAGASSVDAPRAVDPGLMAQLQAGLEQEFARLGIDPAKVAAQAPTGADNAVFDLAAVVEDPDGVGGDPPVDIRLTFTERAIGDYDQNSEVNAADLTPLGQNFQQLVDYDDPGLHDGIEWWPAGDPADGGGAVPPAPPADGSAAQNWRRARIDGDGNGELNIADLTPIANHWHERFDGYMVYERAPGETEFAALKDPGDPLAEFTLPRPDVVAGWPVRYVFLTAPPLDGTYEYYVAAYDALSDTASARSNIVSVDWIAGTVLNLPPVADLVAFPDTGDAPLEVTLDAGASTDSDGTIELYEFDYDGDGGYDVSGVDVIILHTYTDGGIYTVGVRVTDDDGAQDTATATVTVNELPQDPGVSGIVEVLTADWPDPFTPPQKGPLQGVIIGAYEADGTTLLGQSPPSAADGAYTIYNLPARPGGIVVKPIPENPVLTAIIQPITGEHFIFGFTPPVTGRNFLDSGGYHYAGEP